MCPSERRRVHLLAVDDDPGVRAMLTRYFQAEGYRVSTAESGAAMEQQLAREPVDLVLLDVVLPGEDGIELAREIRARSDVGIIMLTGRSELVDRVVGLEVGADDYVAKPFHLRELHARVKTVLRRIRAAAASDSRAGEQVLRFEGWTLNVDRRSLTAPDGSPVVLTSGDFDMLLALVQRAGRVMNRDTLMNLTRGRDREVFDRAIDAQISRLRKKIEADRDRPALIKSVRGLGYVFTGRIDKN